MMQAGEGDPDIFFTDRPRGGGGEHWHGGQASAAALMSPGQRNRECLSFFADEEPGLLRGRSPMQCYVDFMR